MRNRYKSVSKLKSNNLLGIINNGYENNNQGDKKSI